MRLFLAGLYTSNFDLQGRIFSRLTEQEKEYRLSVENYLESYHYVNRASYVKKMRRDGVKVFLDSGAFSAFTKGVQVDIAGYCKYVRDNQDIIECASVLDHIGSAQGTYENQCKMERLGVTPLPCFHYGEDERYLEYYIANYEYITLGGMVPISTPQLQLWLDHLWHNFLADSDGKPKLRVHGFGLTSLPLMKRYPWYSVDSSTWVQWAANGMILVPSLGQINVSDKSSSRKIAGQHIDNIPPVQKEAVVKEIELHGFDVERLRTEYIARWIYNIWAFPYYMREKNDYENDRYTETQMSIF